MSGHVFVIHGNILDSAADAVLVPCDLTADVNAHWGRFTLDAGGRSVVRAELGDKHVSECRSIGDQLYRYVDTGSTPGRADASWLLQRVDAGLEAIRSDVDSDAEVPHNGRARPLVAIPIFGVGDGGFDAIRGQALQAVLSSGRKAARCHGFDVVIVCFKRSDFAAMQLQRADTDWMLTESVRAHAKELAHAVSAQRIVLFLGAGVSMAAGLGDFNQLVSDLESEVPDLPTMNVGMSLPARAARLEERLGQEELKRRVASRVSRDKYALAHGLLASLRVHEAITTNFDDLYERASERPFVDTPLEVVPWQRTDASSPWLLKAHGDANRSGALVFTAASYESFDRKHGPVAGIVRAMFALSREVLFVGYSLKDENIAELIREAADFHKTYQVKNTRLGTVIDIESVEVEVGPNLVRLGIRATTDEPLPESARRLELVLDYVTWLATRGEASWLLDERYAGLLGAETERKTAKRLSTMALPDGGSWGEVRTRLVELGRRQ